MGMENSRKNYSKKVPTEPIEKRALLLNKLNADEKKKEGADEESLNYGQEEPSFLWTDPSLTPAKKDNLILAMEKKEYEEKEKIIQETLEVNEKIDHLHEKYADQVATAHEFSNLIKQIEITKKAIAEKESEKQKLEEKRNQMLLMIKQNTAHQYFDKNQIIAEIKKDPPLEKEFKARQLNDKFLKFLSFGIAKPDSANEIIEYQARQMLAKEYENLAPEFKKILDEITAAQTTEQVLDKQRDKFFAFLDSKQGQEFKQIEDLEKKAERGSTTVKNIAHRDSLN